MTNCKYIGLCGVMLASLASRESYAAQAIDPATLPPTQAIDAPAAERLFGNWGGLQDDLVRLGIGLKLDAITEFAGNVTGGTNKASGFANQIGFGLDINWERLAGVTGLSTHMIVVNRSGTNVSRGFGDNLLPVQEIYGSGGNVVAHLVSLFAQETLFDGRLDWEIGRMNVEDSFASSPLYCYYMNNDLCGDPKALPGGDIGHSAYPEGVWATRLKGRPTPDIYIEAGVYEVNQGLYGNRSFRTGWAFDTSLDSGVYVPVEIGWEPKFGPDKLPGHYKFGVGYDSSAGYKDFTNSLAMASVPGYQLHSHAGNTQFWALADQMLVRNGPGNDAGIIALAGLVENDPNNTVYADQYFAGMIDHGFWNARPDDAVAFLFTYVAASDRLAKVQLIEQSQGLPLSNGATGVQSNEIALELNYQIHVIDGVKFQPDFQYIIRPNAQSNIKDAAVFGFRAYVNF